MLVKDNTKETEKNIKSAYTSQLKMKHIDAFVVGCGTIGSALLEQIREQQSILLEANIVLTVYGIANSKQLMLNKEGISLADWRGGLDSDDTSNHQPNVLHSMLNFIRANVLSNPVLIDCTGSKALSLIYDEVLENNIHIVTANKIANGESIDFYKKLRKLALNNDRKFLYEANVGAGLPVIEPLQKLLKAGDKLSRFEGILSGSLSYIFGELEKGLSLFQATLKARELGFTEPDPREDLNGMDVARKVLIIARENGFDIELSDIKIDSVLPAEYESLDSIDEFLTRLPELDNEFKLRVEQAQQNQQVLRYVASIKNGKCRVAIEAVDQNNPLYGILDGENVLAFYTRYYQPKPLVIRGYGAGGEVTAAGVFGDVLRLVE